MLPTRLVPVPTQVGCGEWDHDQMGLARSDVVVAAGADVALDRLVRLKHPHLDLVVAGQLSILPQPNMAQATSSSTTTNATATIT